MSVEDLGDQPTPGQEIVQHTPQRDTASTSGQQAAARDSRPVHPPGAAQRLQRRYGNQRTQAIIQAKLNIGPVDDPFEREADRISRLAMESQGGSSVQRAPEAIGHVHATTGGAADPGIEQAVERARGGGQPVPDGVRERMERVSGADLSAVRVHVDTESDRLNDALGSRAFTVGPDVFVRRDEYHPGSTRGDALLSHELAHTVQQGAALRTAQTRTPTPVVQRYGDEPYASEKHRRVRIAADTEVYHATTMPFARDIILNGIRNTMNQWGGNAEIKMNERNEWVGRAGNDLPGALGGGFYTHRDKNRAIGWVTPRHPMGAVLKFRVKNAMYGFQAAQSEEFKRKPLEDTPVWTHSVAVGADERELLFRDGGRDLEFVSIEDFGWGVDAGEFETHRELKEQLKNALAIDNDLADEYFGGK